MSARGRPTPAKIRAALAKATHDVGPGEYLGSHQAVAQDVIGPLLWDYLRLRRLLARALDALEETADADMPLASAIREALAETDRALRPRPPRGGGGPRPGAA